MFHVENYKSKDEAQRQLDLVNKMKSIWHLYCICKKPIECNGRYWITYGDKI